MTEGIGQELVERMVALIRDMSRRYNREPMDLSQEEICSFLRRAEPICRELPDPIDPDLIEARKLLAESPMSGGDGSTVEVWMHKAVARGRALEREQRS